MEPVVVGILSILPPLIAITLALWTKDVISSLVIGILSGTLIYAIVTGGGVISAVDYMFTLMASEFNAMMIIFLCILGSLVAVITMAGGARAYGRWASSKVKSASGAKLSTALLGMIIFIDDYFNCLTVGAVMRPVTDEYNISREKLAYIIDAMAAPICIIAPVSSWAASVISYIGDTGLDGMGTFIATIPYNIYAILTIIMVFILSVTKLDFGPMKKYENAARNANNIDEEVKNTSAHNDFENTVVSEKGKVYDLIVPVVSLIVLATLAMLYTGGYFEGGKSLFQAFGDTDANKSLALGGGGALFVAFLLYFPRKVLTFPDFMSGVVLGIKSMVSACTILTLAWTIKGVCTVLSTGPYVSHLVETSNMPVMLIPVLIFLVAALLSFSIGTSWGTFGILIPIVVVVAQAVAPELVIISLSATLAGSIFGDHCSPISDTTILSSTGAGCLHINHVETQLPYAVLVAACSIVGYVIAGFTQNVFITLIVSILLLLAALKFMHNRQMSNAS